MEIKFNASTLFTHAQVQVKNIWYVILEIVIIV